MTTLPLMESALLSMRSSGANLWCKSRSSRGR